MKPAALDLTIYQGTTYNKSFQWKTGAPALPVDLTGCTARMHIRKQLKDVEPVLQLTTENDRIVLTLPLEGKFEIRLTAAETALLTFTQAVYDFEIVYPNGEPVYRLFEGSVEVLPEVTR
jgi:hypothetical protein